MPLDLPRTAELAAVEARLRRSPVVALLGARQVGKTTLARQIMARRKGETQFFDAEAVEDANLLAQPELALRDLRRLVVIDEAQRLPDIFPALRVLADRPRAPARFLILGSASPEMVAKISETLAGRMEFHELSGFSLGEVGVDRMEDLWLRGGLSPKVTLSMRVALEDLGLDRLDVVYPGDRTFPLDRRIRALALRRVLEDLPPLR